MSNAHRSIGCFLAALLITAVLWPSQQATADDAPVVPLAPLSEITQDRLFAAAQYATGKTLYAAGDLAGALSCYQRAWRWAPDEPEARDEIVALALALDRKAVAIRYALLAAESSTEVDSTLLRRLALYATQQRDWNRAERLYERWLASQVPSQDGNEARNEFERLLISLETGRLRYLAGDDREASSAFATVQKALMDRRQLQLRQQVSRALGGSLTSAWEIIARCHLDAGQMALAKQALQPLQQLPAAQGRAHYWLAQIALLESRPLDAYEQLKQCFDAGTLSSEGNDLAPKALELLAETFRSLRDPAGHQRLLQQLLVDHPENLYVQSALADAYQQLGQSDKAIRLREQIVRVASAKPRLSPALGGDAAPSFQRVSLQQVVLKLIDAYSEADKGQLVVPLMEAVGADLLNNELSQAIADACEEKTFRDALVSELKETAASKESPSAVLPRLALAAREVPLANRFQRSLLATMPSELRAGETISWALVLLLKDSPVQAADTLQEGIAADVWEQDDATPYFYLATAYSMSQQVEKALQAASEAAQRSPETADIVARKPAILLQADRKAEAIKAFEDLIKKFDDDRDPATRQTLREARLSLSYLVLDTGDVAKAAEWAEQVLDEFPENAGAKNDLGYLWADAGQHLRRAHRMLSEAVAAEPDKAAYWDSLAWVEHRRGNNSAARKAIETAVRLLQESGEPIDPEILEHKQVIQAAGKR